MFGGSDPVAAGFVTSLARPGGNITGILILARGPLSGKKLELLKEAVPRAARIALLAPRRRSKVPACRAGGGEGGLGAGHQAGCRGGSGRRLRSRLRHDRRRAGAALFVGATPSSRARRKRIIELAASHKLPAMYEWPAQVEDGGLMSYGSAPDALFRRVAAYVDRIFKGAKPGDLPVEQPTTLRAGDQPQDRQGPRPGDPACAPAAGGPGDRMTALERFGSTEVIHDGPARVHQRVGRCRGAVTCGRPRPDATEDSPRRGLDDHDPGGRRTHRRGVRRRPERAGSRRGQERRHRVPLGRGPPRALRRDGRRPRAATRWT